MAPRQGPQNYWIGVGVACLIVFGIVQTFLKRTQPLGPVDLHQVSTAAPSQEDSTAPSPSKINASPSLVQKITIDIEGEVARPGVKQLNFNSRVEDAINAAGGPTAKADLGSVNRAAVLHDGEKVVVLSVKMPGSPSPSRSIGTAPEPRAESARKSTRSAKLQPELGSISLNSATAEELEQLPGVGPAAAQHIIDYRTSNGGFSDISDLGQVKGFSAKRVEKLRPYLRL